MKKSTIAFLTIPAFIAISTFGIASADDAAKDNGTAKQSMQEMQEKGGKHGKRGGHNPERMLKKLTQQLTLTETQQGQIKALYEDNKDEKMSAKASAKALHEAVRSLDVNAADFSTKLAAAKQQATLIAHDKIDDFVEKKQAMAKILTPEQMQKLEKMKMERGEKHGKKGPKPSAE